MCRWLPQTNTFPDFSLTKKNYVFADFFLTVAILYGAIYINVSRFFLEELKAIRNNSDKSELKHQKIL